VVFAGRKVAIQRPRCARGKGGKWSWTVTRVCNTTGGGSARCGKDRGGADVAEYRRAVQSVVEGYGIEKSSVSREFVQASAAQLQELCEKQLGELDLVAILIDGIHLGKQVLVVALGIAVSGEKHVLGCGRARRKTPRWSRNCWKTWWPMG